MQNIAISSSQFVSCAFLHQFVERSFFTLSAERQESAELSISLACTENDSEIDSELSQLPLLVVSAGGLNIEKIWAIQQALVDFDITAWQVSQPRSKMTDRLIARGFCNGINADISDQQLLQLNEKLEAIATLYQVEMSLVFPEAPDFNQPGLLVMDMDGTMINMECIDQIALLAGVGDEVAKVTEQAMQGELEFAASLHCRVALFHNADEPILQQVRQSLPLMPGIEALIKTLKQQGWKIAIASGGFTYFADYLKQRLDLDAAFSNQLGIINGKITGEVTGELVDAQRKAEVVVELAEQFGIPLSQTVAMGDGANDLVMMGQAGLGVAYKAKLIVRQQAQTAIRFAGLDTMLEYLR